NRPGIAAKTPALVPPFGAVPCKVKQRRECNGIVPLSTEVLPGFFEARAIVLGRLLAPASPKLKAARPRIAPVQGHAETQPHAARSQLGELLVELGLVGWSDSAVRMFASSARPIEPCGGGEPKVSGLRVSLALGTKAQTSSSRAYL